MCTLVPWHPSFINNAWACAALLPRCPLSIADLKKTVRETAGVNLGLTAEQGVQMSEIKETMMRFKM